MTIPINKGAEESEAKILIEYAREEAELTPEMLISLIKDLIAEKQDFKARYWSWKVIEYIDQKTGAVSVDMDADADVETGDWGLPVIVSGGSWPVGYEIRNKKYLIKLLEYIENQVHDVFLSISKYFIHKDNPKWVCQSCGRYLGKRLTTYEEIQKLLTKFSIGQYWRCRSCKKNNWFEIDAQGFIHFWSD
jgi:rubrerythrin